MKRMSTGVAPSCGHYILSSFDWAEGSHPLIGSARLAVCRDVKQAPIFRLPKANATNAARGTIWAFVRSCWGKGARRGLFPAHSAMTT